MPVAPRRHPFLSVRSMGALFPEDMLMRVGEGRTIPGCAPVDYGVVDAGSVADEAERHWDYLLGAWRELRRRLPLAGEGENRSDPTGSAVHRWVAPLLDELGFGRLGALRIEGVHADDDPGRFFPVGYRWQHVPIHVVTWARDLDRPERRGVPSPRSVLQEALNSTRVHQWGLLTNGRSLLLMRDSTSFSMSEYVEFDLEAMFDGELFSDFVLFYRMLHASRFEVEEGDLPSSCWMEKWRVEAARSGVRALDALRDNVERALSALGTGFLCHPANNALRQHTDAATLHRALLRLTYRLLFWFVIEDRDLLHPPGADERTRERYAAYFSSARLRRRARARAGTSHHDLYETLNIVLDALGDEDGRPELGLSGLGGLFAHSRDDEPLKDLRLANHALLEAVRHLVQVWDPRSRRWRVVDYASLSARELGSVYEALLETVPEYGAGQQSLTLVARAENERKRTGAYYTPTSLIERLLDSTLDPVLDEAVKRGEANAATWGEVDAGETIAEELLSVTVCDPACGSGHFLVAAAHRIAKRVAAVREHTPEPSEEAFRHAIHEVVARCLYGVDINPMAIDLAKVALWLEGMESGRPLDLLDPHLKHGNALLGATPRQLRAGVPDAAFVAVEGDDPKVATALMQANAREREGQVSLFDTGDGAVKVANTTFAEGLHEIYAIRTGSLRDVHRQEKVYEVWRRSPDYLRDVHVADAWCANFMWEETAQSPYPVTAEIFRAMDGPRGAAAPARTHEEIARLRERYRFFHWHLEFPDVFRVPEDGLGVDPETGWDGGFDVVLSNPPWDKVDFEDKKYFAVVEPSIARMAGMTRRRRIAEWQEEFPEAGEGYRRARREVKSIFHFAARSGSYAQSAKGLSVKGVNSLQVEQLFIERFAAIGHRRGRIGAVVPTAVATGAGGQHLFRDLSDRQSVASLYDFDNTDKVFIDVHASYKFCLLTLVGRWAPEPAARFAFLLREVAEIDDSRREFKLSSEEISLLNPNTGTLPVFRSRRDAELTISMYRQFPVLWDESTRSGNHWGIKFKRLFDMTDDSGLFRTREDLQADGWELEGNIFVRDGQRMLPLYEGKMAHHFDHRWNSFTGTESDSVRRLSPVEKRDSTMVARPRYWVPEHDVPTGRMDRGGRPSVQEGTAARLSASGWGRGWLYGWRDVCRATDERTAIPAMLPYSGVGHTLPLMLSQKEPRLVAALYAVQSSLVFDYVSRQKISGIHMSLSTWKQLPVPVPADLEPHTGFLVPRVLELACTTRDMEPLARDLGHEGPPFRWVAERRALMRAELDAYVFHLYGLGRDDAEYVLETFQTDSGGLKNNEIARYGTYRTRDLVLEAFDRMELLGVSIKRSLTGDADFGSTLSPAPGVQGS